MWNTIFIAAHAATATAALIAGAIALSRARLFGVYLASLVAMEVFLLLAVGVQWSADDAATRAVFAALTALGAVVVGAGFRAREARLRDDADSAARYFDSVGFTLVALMDAFLVIAVLSAGGPGWALAATGVLVAVAGHVVLGAVRRPILSAARGRS